MNDTEDRWLGGCRKSFGKPLTLPSPRLVSIYVHKNRNANEEQLSHLVTQYGAFLDHDFVLTPENEDTGCCNNSPSADCFPIKVPYNDQFFKRFVLIIN